MPRLALFVTDFADGGVIVPLCLAVAATLLLLRQRRAAWAWIGVTTAVWGVMLALKMGGYACETIACAVPPPSIDLVSPSGHVAASAAAYGGLLGLFLRSTGRPAWQACAGAVAIAVLVGITRIVLHEHSVSEVIVGGVVGVAGAALFTSMVHGLISAQRRAVLLGVVCFSVLLFHGTHLTWEQDIKAVSRSAIQHLDPGQ